VYLDVDDAPFVVTSLRVEGPRIVLHLVDDTEEELDYASLRIAPSGVAYAQVKGRFPARFSRAAFTALGERMVEREGSMFLETPSGLQRLA
jgi:hypothetical protein